MKLKYYLLSLSLVLFFAFQSQAQSQKSLLVGKWKMDMDYMKVQMEKIMKSEMSEEMSALPPEQLKMMMDMALGSLESMRTEFKADGTFKAITVNPMNNQKEEEKGTWDIKDGYIITIEETDDPSDVDGKIKIKEITAKRLVLLNDEANNPVKELIMIRAND